MFPVDESAAEVSAGKAASGVHESSSSKLITRSQAIGITEALVGGIGLHSVHAAGRERAVPGKWLTIFGRSTDPIPYPSQGSAFVRVLQNKLVPKRIMTK